MTTPRRRLGRRSRACGTGKRMRRMDGSISSALALLVLALHLAVDGCSAVNFEGTGRRGLAADVWFRLLHLSC